jgi:ADP-heptose:LPS heptosyltransferase
MIQASSVFPLLRAQGYRVVVNTTPRGFDIAKHDPNVDDWIIQEKDQVPNAVLSEYWTRLSERFGKFVNLSESVEGALLSLAGDRSWSWNTKFRDMVLNVDYVEAQHAIAGVDGPQNPRFYPSKDERKWALDYKRKCGHVVLWALSGSAVHKAYPHTDNVIAALMLETKSTVVFVGDANCQILEGGWSKEKRVIRKSGKWSIRESLAFAQMADVVVGPETGVLNAVAQEPNKKVLLLSHSAKENLGGRWKNTTCLKPEGCECFPCHKLHYGWATCNRHDDGAAKCASLISPQRVYEAINDLS